MSLSIFYCSGLAIFFFFFLRDQNRNLRACKMSWCTPANPIPMPWSAFTVKACIGWRQRRKATSITYPKLKTEYRLHSLNLSSLSKARTSRLLTKSCNCSCSQVLTPHAMVVSNIYEYLQGLSENTTTIFTIPAITVNVEDYAGWNVHRACQLRWLYGSFWHRNLSIYNLVSKGTLDID